MLALVSDLFLFYTTITMHKYMKLKLHIPIGELQHLIVA